MPKRQPKVTAPIPPVVSEEITQAILTQEDEAPPSTGSLAEVVYPTVEIVEYSSTSPRGPLTQRDIVDLLDWEPEDEYQKRMVEENPGSEPQHWLYGDDYHCLDTKKRKVRCNNNANNRPFDEGWCEDLIHTLLVGQWAGPLMMPGETINGETVRISRYGRVLSAQHTLTAAKLANERLQESRAKPGNAKEPKYPAWNGHAEVVLETIVVTGLSEDERVLRTIDYVKPRTVADMLYTMPLFRVKENDAGEKVPTTPVERKELTRMLSGAIDFLWARTKAQGYKTHPEVVGFLERHKRLLKCVEPIFLLNKKAATGGRKISTLRLSPGMCAALMYIMGSSGPKTDGDFYRNEFPPTERVLDWSLWDKAQDFWDMLAKHNSFMQVRRALHLLVDSTPTDSNNMGLGGRLNEKLAILANAWSRWKDHPEGAPDPFEEMDLQEGGILFLNYSDLGEDGLSMPEGMIKLLDTADFFGIDCPDVMAGEEAPTAEEVERIKEEVDSLRGQPKTPSRGGRLTP